MVKRDRERGRGSLRERKRALNIWKEDVPRRTIERPSFGLKQDLRVQLRSKNLMQADVRVLAGMYGVSEERAARVLVVETEGYDIAIEKYQGWNKPELNRAQAARKFYSDQEEYLTLVFGRSPRI